MIQSLLPAAWHRRVLATLQPVRLWLWGVMRREVEGIMVLAFDDQGRLLMVRHSYHLPDQWLVPGGGRSRHESPLAAATRELAEETGCTLSQARHIGQVRRTMPGGWINRIELVTGRAHGTAHADGREIIAIGWFDRAGLPPETNAAVHLYLDAMQRSEG